MGVDFRYGFSVQSFVTRGSGDRLEAARLSGGADVIEGDHFVLATGAASAGLVKPLGIRLPIYPIKGYSISMEAHDDLPRLSVTDFDRKVVYAPLRATEEGAMPVIRVAGLADLVGYDTSVDEARLTVLLAEVARAFPRAAASGQLDKRKVRPWAGLRPATPRGKPLLGPTRVSNLYLNTGHGGLGWTLAHGTAKLVSDLIIGRSSELPIGPFLMR